MNPKLATFATTTTLLLFACGEERQTEARSSGLAPAPTRSAAHFEVDFMTEMIDHHQMAIEMSELCVERAIHEELRAMCENMIAAQSAEIELMQSWLADWYDQLHEPMMKPGAERKMEKLAMLEGEEFEIAFLEMMIRHHGVAVRQSSGCVERAYHEELINLCEEMMAAQSEEIEQMESWLCAWYGRC